VMELACRISGEKGRLRIVLPMAQLERAYMLMDALHGWLPNGFILHDGSRNMVCQYRAAGDGLYDGVGLMLSADSIDCIKRMLFSVLQRPADAVWLHVDIETDGGDVSVRVVND